VTEFHKAVKNTLSGYVEPANLSEFQFEIQRRTFNNYGYAIDPTSTASGDRIVGNSAEAIQNNSKFFDGNKNQNKRYQKLIFFKFKLRRYSKRTKV
jgi:pre-mRNA-processing factor 17